MRKNSDLKSSYAARLSLQLNKQWVVPHSLVSSRWCIFTSLPVGERLVGNCSYFLPPLRLLLLWMCTSCVWRLSWIKCCVWMTVRCSSRWSAREQRERNPDVCNPIESPLNHFAVEISGFSPAWGLFDTASDKTKQTHKARQDPTGFKVGCRVWT